jgi:hypothetical protein
LPFEEEELVTNFPRELPVKEELPIKEELPLN